jgi:hypothetical protein
MMKNFLRRIVTAAIVATTIGSFSSIGVSAATFDSNINNYYNTIANNFLNTGLVMPNNITSTDNLKSNTATNNTSTSENSVDVQGLAALPTKYSINVQASAEQKILELMNAKEQKLVLSRLL